MLVCIKVIHKSTILWHWTLYLLKGMHKHIANTKLVHLQKAKAVIFILHTCSPQTLYCYERRSCKTSSLMLKEPFGYTEEATLQLKKMGSIQPQLGIQALKNLNGIFTDKFGSNSQDLRLKFIYVLVSHSCNKIRFFDSSYNKPGTNVTK